MEIKNNYKSFSLILIFLSLSSFFFGFYLDENSAGGGAYLGDWIFLWPNLQLFINNDLHTAINSENLLTNRTPLLYILHAALNPFVENEIEYRRSVFLISFIAPILFYFCLKKKFKSEDNLLLVLIASTIFLSPYFRTSAFWGLEENYAFICLLFTFLFLNYFLENKNEYNFKIYIQIFLTTFFSSLCIYFDQKLIIIPLIAFLAIINSNRKKRFKLISIFFYLILSLPYIYLITLWGGLFPKITLTRNLTSQFYFEHIGYTCTIIAFYFFPFLLFRGKSFFYLVKNFFLEKINYYFILPSLIYIFYFLGLSIFFGQDPLSIEDGTGKGIVHKISFILFTNNLFLREIFIYFSFFISWIFIILFIDKNFKNMLIFLYFLVLSIFTRPLMQEYFDPLILLLIFTFFNSKLIINYKNVIILFFYLSFFLLGSNIYYYKLLN